MKSYRHLGGSNPLIGQPIHEYLTGPARQYADHEALVSLPQAKRLTYAELFREVEDLAKGLLALDVRKGDRVGIWSTNNQEWVLLQLATARVGAVLVNINPAYRTAELAHAARAAKLNTLFLIPSFRKSNYLAMVGELCPEVNTQPADHFRSEKLPELKNLVVYDPADPMGTQAPAPGYFTWPQIIERGAQVPDDACDLRAGELEVDDPINIQFTSGTTGFAKPVVLTHHNILNNAWFVGEELKLTPEDRLCVPVPFYHCFGMVLGNLASFSHGATVVIPAEHFEARAVLSAIAAERCTALHGVPTMFVTELALPDFASFDLSSLRTGIMAGAPCPPPLMRRVIDEMNCREVLIAYGQTEASPVTHLTRVDDTFERRVETVGTNLPHQEVKIVDPDTNATVDLGVPGEICFRGYHVMRGYYGMEASTHEAIDKDGWLHSGDLGTMDEDGYVRITGRLKDMIIRGGENIYPVEIEAHLMTHPKITQAAVYGMPDDFWGEEVAAWIQLNEGETMSEEEVCEFAKTKLAHYKVPRAIRFVTEFPLTVTGKIQKFRIREQEMKSLGN
ncbi:MAG: AMP-binding protein [Acidobacteriota bacterium]|nr:AMP-binding protein [Acidobacteriota bacterium]